MSMNVPLDKVKDHATFFVVHCLNCIGNVTHGKSSGIINRYIRAQLVMQTVSPTESPLLPAA